jgi:hypothetical protein
MTAPKPMTWFHWFLFRWTAIYYMMKVPKWCIGSIFLAVIIGYNELAKMQTELGQKAICRAMKRISTIAATQLGITEPEFTGNYIVLSVSVDCHLPDLEFRESDIELMRGVVAKYDSKKSRGA